MDDTNPFLSGLACIKTTKAWRRKRAVHQLQSSGDGLLCRPEIDIWTKCEGAPAGITAPTCQRCVKLAADQ